MDRWLIEARNASKWFEQGASRVAAVSAVACRVAPGDKIAVVGPSGSGKSTLLYLLAGIEKPSDGAVLWPVFGATERLGPECAGFAFQSANLLAPLTVRENVALPLLLAGIDGEHAAQAAHDALERFDLAELADRLPDDLSAGQAQRIGIARAVVAEPAVVFADEPTGQLDGPTAAHVIGRLIEAAEAFGAALIVATHDERVATRLSTCWTMAHGRLATPA